MTDKKRQDAALARALIRQNRQLIGQHRELLKFIEATLPPPIDETTFIPNSLQQAVLDALDGKGLRTDALLNKIDSSRRQLFKVPGGLPELQEEGLVDHHRRVGFYRPDAPPPEVTQLTGG